MMGTILYALLAAFGGAMLPLQAAINAQLAGRIGGTLWAGAASSLVMVLAFGAVLAGTGSRPPGTADIVDVPWWLWSAGLFGATLLGLSIAVAPKLGAAAMIAFIVAGQLVVSLVLDHFGLLGLPEHPINAWRLIGAGLLAAGVGLIRFT